MRRASWPICFGAPCDASPLASAARRDTVTDHGHDTTLGLQAGDGGNLVGRQHVGDHVDVVDSDVRGNGQRRRAIVAGQEDRAQTEGAKRSEAGGTAGLDGVGQNYQTRALFA